LKEKGAFSPPRVRLVRKCLSLARISVAGSSESPGITSSTTPDSDRHGDERLGTRRCFRRSSPREGQQNGRAAYIWRPAGLPAAVDHMSRRETQKIMNPKPDNPELAEALILVKAAALLQQIVLNEAVLSYFKLRFPQLRAEKPSAPIQLLASEALKGFPLSYEGLAFGESLASAFTDCYKKSVRSQLVAASSEGLLPPHLIDAVHDNIRDARFVAMNGGLGFHEIGHPSTVTIAGAMAQARELARKDVNLILPKVIAGIRDRKI